ncbi:MAG: hypothetical protein WCK39_04540 [Methanomassiliicoccales archaeon]
MVEVIHLDSSLLRGLVDPDDDPANRSEAKRLLNSSPEARFRISILAAGEVIGKIAETKSVSCGAGATAELSRLFRRRRLDMRGIGKGYEAMELAVELMKSDPLITPADALLVAIASKDDECDAFATLDNTILESKVLERQATSYRVRVLDARMPRRRKYASSFGKEVNMFLNHGSMRIDS